ncbi:MAG: ATP-binding cassette domain-containing protein [Gammaproteobacteria bacterium]|nr:ATP-binding cassette domain-containing protein [Gammaproteobacteria bacterium]
MSAVYELEQVRFAYDRAPVLDINSFNIVPGSITAIIGANGSGKTTLLNMLAMLLLPDSGTLRFQGKDVRSENFSRLRKHIGYVQQKPYLLNMPVRENIELGMRFRHVSGSERHARCDRIMDRLGITHLADRHSGDLSGGEVQKVAIARALVLEPEVLILDEPFTHLDRHAVAFFESLIRQLRSEQEKTIILSSHDQVAAQLLSDDIYSMVHGQLVPSAMTNLYQGKVIEKEHVFDSGHVRIHIPEDIANGSHLAIDPEHLVLSRNKLESSMRNQFQGRIAAVQEKKSRVQITIEAGESFHVIITHDAMRELDVHFGDNVWVSFKSSAVHVF